MVKPVKPLGRKAYGSIPHLPGSRLGPGDHKVHKGQEAICCERARDRHDRVIVTEKLDGSNVAVANVDGEIFALGRAGYLAETSPYDQHQMFATWVRDQHLVFASILREGESLHGEWLIQAHGTIYDLSGRSPFVAFDMMRDGRRVGWDDLTERVGGRLALPYVVSDGPPISVANALLLLGDYGHYGAKDLAEGVVWRVERRGKFDFMAKYVRNDKVEGKYLPGIGRDDPIWLWRAA